MSAACFQNDFLSLYVYMISFFFLRSLVASKNIYKNKYFENSLRFTTVYIDIYIIYIYNIHNK